MLIIGRFYIKYSMMNITVNSENSNQLAFLVLDDVEEYENEFRNYFSRYKDPAIKLSDDEYYCNFHVNLRKLILSGRKKNKKDWDLKILCAITLIVRFHINILQIKMADHIDTNFRKKPCECCVAEDSSTVKELRYYCGVVAGKEDQFLPTVKLKTHKLLCGSNFMKIMTVLKALYANTHSQPMNEDLETTICSQKVHPLSIAFRCIADGQLHKDLPRMVRVMEDIEKCVEERAHFINQDQEGMKLAWGECLIINQTFKNVYDSTNRCYYRPGTERDEEELIRVFEQLGCKGRIHVERDLTKLQMMEVLRNFVDNLEESKPPYMTVVLLSHGCNFGGVEFILDIEMNGVPISAIKNMFIDRKICPSMVGKPKMFFIQSCRGSRQHELQPIISRYIKIYLQHNAACSYNTPVSLRISIYTIMLCS